MDRDIPGHGTSGTQSPWRPVMVEVIAYTPTVFYHCQHCELIFQHAGFGDAVRREEARHALPDDLRDEFQGLSNWVHSLWMRYGRRISVSVIDAASIEGVWKSLRYRVRRYPAVIVDRREVRVGPDFGETESVIARSVAAAGA